MLHVFPRMARRGGPGRWLALILIAALPIGGAALVRADLPATSLRLSADEARRQGIVLAISHRAFGTSDLVTLVGSPASAPGGAHAVLLAAAPDGAAVAIVADPLDPGAGVTIVHADGSVARSTIPGVAAAFAPGSEWLALVDAQGVLWRVEADSGEGRQLAQGPFVGPPVFLADGSLLLQGAPSAEAPYASWPVRIDPHGGGELAAPAVEDPLVLGMQPLDDGSLAIVTHRPGGQVVVRRSSGPVSTVLAELPGTAVDVAVSSEGAHVAWATPDAGLSLRDVADGRTRSLGEGRAPWFAPDGTSLLVERDGSMLVLDLDGGIVASLGPVAAGWTACGEECGR